MLRVAAEYDVDLILAGVLEGHRVADEISQAGVPVILNSMTNLPTMESLAATYENAARLRAGGVTVLLSSFDGANVRNLRQVAGYAVAYGMDHADALASVTSVPARVFGVDDSLGSLEAGKIADVVVWTGDPFELTTWAEHVFIEGAAVSDDTRQKALFERYRELSRLPPQP